MKTRPRFTTLLLVTTLAYVPPVIALASPSIGSVLLWGGFFLIASLCNLIGPGGDPLSWRLGPMAWSALHAAASALVGMFFVPTPTPARLFGAAILLLGFRPIVEIFRDEEDQQRPESAGAFSIAGGTWICLASLMQAVHRPAVVTACCGIALMLHGALSDALSARPS